MRSSTLSRIELRVEDVLTVFTAAVMLLFLGVKSFGLLHLDEARYWDFGFILLPVAWFFFRAPVAYASRPFASAGTPSLIVIPRPDSAAWFPCLSFFSFI